MKKLIILSALILSACVALPCEYVLFGAGCPKQEVTPFPK